MDQLVVVMQIAGSTAAATEPGGHENSKELAEGPATPKRKLARRRAAACEDTPDSKHVLKRRRLRRAKGGSQHEDLQSMHEPGAKTGPQSGKGSDQCIADMHYVQHGAGKGLTVETVEGMKVCAWSECSVGVLVCACDYSTRVGTLKQC